MTAALQEIINYYNSPILKWERFKDSVSRRRWALEFGDVFNNAERAIYKAVESGGKVNILSELEKALASYRTRVIRKSIE